MIKIIRMLFSRKILKSWGRDDRNYHFIDIEKKIVSLSNILHKGSINLI